MKNRIPYIFILIFTVILSTQCEAQKKNENSQIGINTIAAEISKPSDEAKITGKAFDYEIKESSLEYLQSLPLPNIQFVFENQKIELEDLSDDVKKVLSDHWKEAIKFSYNEHFSKPENAQAGLDRDMAWLRFCNKTQQKLEKLSINAPNGKRKISQTEAINSFGFLNEEARDLIDKAKNFIN